MLLASSLAASLALLPSAADADPDLPALAQDALIWGVPLVLTGRYLDVAARAGIPFNQFVLSPSLATPATRALGPQVDTLYGLAWINLATPQVIEVPDTHDRYYSIQLLDAYDDSFAYIGRRATGTKAGAFVLTPPGFTGSIPSGMREVKAPTRRVLALVRTLIRSTADLPAAHTVQSSYALCALDEYPHRRRAGKFRQESPNLLPVIGLAGGGAGDLNELNGLIKAYPPLPEDAANLDRFAPLGVGLGKTVADPKIRTLLPRLSLPGFHTSGNSRVLSWAVNGRQWSDPELARTHKHAGVIPRTASGAGSGLRPMKLGGRSDDAEPVMGERVNATVMIKNAGQSPATNTGGALTATLNFARDRSDGGIWSNFDPTRASIRAGGRQVPIGDASTLAETPRLDREGFALLDRAVPDARWDDTDWIDRFYIPACLEMVKTITGADFVGLIHPGVLRRRADPTHKGPEYVPPARFVHFDQSADSIAPYLARAAGDGWRERYKTVRGFNIWRCISPPPQNTPLALCDQRTFDRDDMVIGHLVEPGLDHPIEYATALYNPAQRWWYYPAVGAEQVLVFKGFDLDPVQPMGCLHSAFDHPAPVAGAPVRESIENRVLAFFA